MALPVWEQRKISGPHKIGHELSAKYDVAHGASLSAVWESWAEYVYMEEPERIREICQNGLGYQRGRSGTGGKAWDKSNGGLFPLSSYAGFYRGTGNRSKTEEELEDMAARATGK